MTKSIFCAALSLLVFSCVALSAEAQPRHKHRYNHAARHATVAGVQGAPCENRYFEDSYYDCQLGKEVLYSDDPRCPVAGFDEPVGAPCSAGQCAELAEGLDIAFEKLETLEEAVKVLEEKNAELEAELDKLEVIEIKDEKYHQGMW